MENILKRDFVIGIKNVAKVNFQKFYEKFVLSFNDDDIWLETSIKLVINIDSKEFKYIDYNNKIRYDYYQIIKQVGRFYGIYQCESDFYKDYFNKYFGN